jgi:hypothetical protein
VAGKTYLNISPRNLTVGNSSSILPGSWLVPAYAVRKPQPDATLRKCFYVGLISPAKAALGQRASRSTGEVYQSIKSMLCIVWLHARRPRATVILVLLKP